MHVRAARGRFFARDYTLPCAALACPELFMSRDPILYCCEEHIARITLNRPANHNALGADEVKLFHGLLERLEAERDARVLLLDAAGDRTFCAGASLKQMQRGDMSGDLFTTLTDRLAGLRIPSVCAL